MPTTYAHDRFGREVYEKLQEELRERIRRYKKIYLIGLHGPDIFFYYHPLTKNRISELGNRMHEKTAAEFFQEGIRLYQEHPSEALEVYLLGFACHFMLDSTCHPYIGRFVEHTGISHAKIETHLDRYLMLEDGKEPLIYQPAVSICPNSRENRVIHRCFPMVSEGEITECLKGMKLYTRVTICRHGLTRGLMRAGMKLAGCYDSMEGRLMPSRPDPKCEAGTMNLVRLYEKALRDTPAELIGLDEAITGGGVLSPRFDHNYE